jgi:glycosyltransferase involved in cell wall biosynthesis
LSRVTPEVSVVIPTRSRWRLLAATLEGALRQADVEHEVVVVDDGSTDETFRRLKELDEPRLRVVHHETSRHLPAARNSGIAAARGEWIAFLDDDDLWSPRKLRSLLDAAQARDAVFAYSAGVVIDPHGTVLQTWPAPDAEDLLQLLLRGNWIPAGGSNPIASADVVRRLGGFDEGLRHFAEWDMWIRLSAGGRAAACPEPLVAYVLHSENMVLVDSRAVVRELGRFVAKHRRRAATYGVTPDRVVPDRMGARRWLGWAHARAGRRLRAAGWYASAALAPSPYGRRQSLADAGRALLGAVPMDRRPVIDEEAIRAAGWLADYGLRSSR